MVAGLSQTSDNLVCQHYNGGLKLYILASESVVDRGE